MSLNNEGEKMALGLLDKIKEAVSEDCIFLYEPMSKHTTFRTGGVADIFVVPNDINDLIKLLNITKDVTIIGNGSNMLVSDKGIRGVTISLRNFTKCEINDTTITAQSGILLSKLSNLAYENSLSGLEFASGIPGTLGGATYMNAGAYGQEMKDIVVSSKYLNLDTFEICEIQNHEYEYRKSIYQKNITGIILEVTLKLEKSDKELIKQKMQENFEHRKSKQPLEFPSAGSIFKREEGIVVSKLIDEAGLKGYKIGGAEVSTKHAGFIINSGNATSKDVLDLINYIKSTIKEKYNVEIHEEIRLVGEF